MSQGDVLLTPDKPISNQKTPQRYLFLDGIRGFAALYVTFYHFLGWNVSGVPSFLSQPLRVFGFGHTAVALFIVLSGVSLMLPVARASDRQLRGGMSEYLRRRARRILPPYYAAFALSLIAPFAFAALLGVSRPLPDTGDILTHLSLTHNLFPQWSSSINITLWSVATEWQIYFLFPLVFLPVWRRFGLVSVILCGFLLGLAPIVCAETTSAACPWYIGLFSLGMATTILATRITAETSSSAYIKRLCLSLLAIITLYIVAVLLQKRFINWFGEVQGIYLAQTLKDGLMGAGVVCLILYGFLMSRPGSAPSLFLQMLESQPGRFLASFSYSLYLIHAVVLTMILIAAQAYRWNDSQLFIGRLMGIPLALCGAYGFYLIFERPFTTFGKPKSVRNGNSGKPNSPPAEGAV